MKWFTVWDHVDQVLGLNIVLHFLWAQGWMCSCRYSRSFLPMHADFSSYWIFNMITHAFVLYIIVYSIYSTIVSSQDASNLLPSFLLDWGWSANNPCGSALEEGVPPATGFEVIDFVPGGLLRASCPMPLRLPIGTPEGLSSGADWISFIYSILIIKAVAAPDPQSS